MCDFFSGGPGSGKGTQCEKLVEKYGFTHLSTGELLRHELSSDSERSKLIRDTMERGDLVPSPCSHHRHSHALMVLALLAPADGTERLGPAPAVVRVAAAALISPQEQWEVEKPSGVIRAGSCCSHPVMAPSDRDRRWALAAGGVILELLQEAMAASLRHTTGFLIDGYPREVKQGEEFGRRIGDPHLVICMDCSADTMTNRLRQRSQSSPGASSTAAVAQRLEAYHRASIPVIAYYEAKTRLQKVRLGNATPDASGTKQ
ncbi:hypothetical protein QTO34_018443 [Cnephaeus nilssonii]|uniref:Nucleoside-diphosphate kinase n=1 Tax=Cnephaeus nilssonii TaxID=3371016 RepID=A0AA40LQ05_CNENI|nr:hypothetical protein QTO34_018443 [Eptesicus nilssonii]